MCLYLLNLRGCLVVLCIYSETKVVLKGNNTVQLTDLATKAGNLGLPNFSVQDAGKTQVKIASSVLKILEYRVLQSTI